MLDLYIALGRMDILTILILLIHEQGTYFLLLMSVSFFKDFVFIVEVFRLLGYVYSYAYLYIHTLVEMGMCL